MKCVDFANINRPMNRHFLLERTEVLHFSKHTVWSRIMALPQCLGIIMKLYGLIACEWIITITTTTKKSCPIDTTERIRRKIVWLHKDSDFCKSVLMQHSYATYIWHMKDERKTGFYGHSSCPYWPPRDPFIERQCTKWGTKSTVLVLYKNNFQSCWS